MSSVGEADAEKAHFFVISKVYLCRMAQHLEKSCTKEKDSEKSIIGRRVRKSALLCRIRTTRL